GLRRRPPRRRRRGLLRRRSLRGDPLHAARRGPGEHPRGRTAGRRPLAHARHAGQRHGGSHQPDGRAHGGVLMRFLVGFLSAAALVLVLSSPAFAFRKCTDAGTPSGHWPAPRRAPDTPALLGTQRWDFDGRAGADGLEVSNVRYPADLSQPKKMVLRRGGLPFLPVHYPSTASLTCDVNNGGPHGYNDKLS